MKAIRIHDLGGPEVLRFEEAPPPPEPGPGQILVRVHAAGVNPADWKIREGQFGKILLPSVMGIDFSGVVEKPGPGVTEFDRGTPVFGSVAGRSGSYAEYALARVSQVAEKPAALPHVEAAALPVPALTAWQALFDNANLQAGQTLLIHGAAGGVGGFAVQFARWKGARAIGTASAGKHDLVRSLGAEQVIDYRSARFEEIIRDVDVVLDTIGGDTQERSWKVLKPGGILVSLVAAPSDKAAAARGARGVLIRENADRADQLARIAELVVTGKIKANVETVLPLREARKAQEISQNGHARGRIVLAIEADPGLVL